MDVAYPQLSNWTCLQQTLIAQLAQTVNDAFSAMMRGSDVQMTLGGLVFLLTHLLSKAKTVIAVAMEYTRAAL